MTKADSYARAILELNKKGDKADSIIEGLLKSLRERGSLLLLPQILSAYKRLTYRGDSNKAVMTVARESDKEECLKSLNIDANNLDFKIDERLIGGYRLEQDGKLLDNSFKAKLLQVYRNATKA